jgi:hypothetical protein
MNSVQKMECIEARHAWCDASIYEVPPGWLDLVDDLLCRVKVSLTEADRGAVRVSLKEKFGELRASWSYARFSDEDGDADLLCSSEGIAEIERITDEYEEMSHKVCQVCGGPAETMSNRGWMATVCAEHLEGRRKVNAYHGD